LMFTQYDNDPKLEQEVAVFAEKLDGFAPE
jgi:hypothetical protein